MTRRVAWILPGWKIQVLVIQITTGLVIIVTLHMIILFSFYLKIAISSNIINSSQQSLWLKSENLQQWYQSPWFSQHQAQNAAAMTEISQFWKMRIEQCITEIWEHNTCFPWALFSLFLSEMWSRVDLEYVAFWFCREILIAISVLMISLVSLLPAGLQAPHSYRGKHRRGHPCHQPPFVVALLAPQVL